MATVGGEGRLHARDCLPSEQVRQAALLQRAETAGDSTGRPAGHVKTTNDAFAVLACSVCRSVGVRPRFSLSMHRSEVAQASEVLPQSEMNADSIEK